MKKRIHKVVLDGYVLGLSGRHAETAGGDHYRPVFQNDTLRKERQKVSPVEPNYYNSIPKPMGQRCSLVPLVRET